MEPVGAILLFLLCLAVGAFSTYTGGGSLITIPALMLLGLPPHIAVATNRLGVMGIMIGSWYKFHRMKMMSYKVALPLSVAILIGSLIGASLLIQVDEAFLKTFVSIVTLALLALLIIKPEMGIKGLELHSSPRRLATATVLTFLLGIYSGFYGAAGGTFLAYITILVLGQTFIESAAARKPIILVSSIAAAAIFVLQGLIYYDYAAVVFIGTLAGSYAGAHYSKRLGNVWIKRMFIVAVAVMALKLLF